MNEPTVLLGYQVGTVLPVSIPIRHMAVTGQTQSSGKTTTLEALVARSGVRALAFVTKRGEKAFTSGNKVQPYFRDRADWQFVTSILDVTLQEKNKFLRPWIIRICRTTKTLADVQDKVREALRTAKGVNEGVYTQLDAYLDLIVPEIRRTPLASGLELEPGLNVMDLSAHPGPMQMLFIQSALDWINERESNTVIVIPEAWETVPQSKSTPVKASAVALVRKGAGLRNFLWLDSQDMAGVDNVLLRACTVWLIGVQREANELRRNLANIPKGVSRPTVSDVALLGKGQFFACWEKHAVMTYVQPSWMDDQTAKSVAIHNKKPPAQPEPEPVDMPSQRERELEKENHTLRAELNHLLGEVERLRSAVERQSSSSSNHKSGNDRPTQDARGNGNAGWTPAEGEDALYERFKTRLVAEAPALLRVLTTRHAIDVEVVRETIRVDGKSTRGRVARLIAEGFFEKARTSADVQEELSKRGERPSNIELGNELKALTEMGFFTRENKWINLVSGAEVNVIER